MKVMSPKVAGAWNLHTLSEKIPLNFFICFSSAAALVGSPGQGNYAAANAKVVKHVWKNKGSVQLFPNRDYKYFKIYSRLLKLVWVFSRLTGLDLLENFL